MCRALCSVLGLRDVQDTLLAFKNLTVGTFYLSMHLLVTWTINVLLAQARLDAWG